MLLQLLFQTKQQEESYLNFRKGVIKNRILDALIVKNKRQARSLREKGMPHLKLNGHEIRYNPEEIEQWMARNAKK